MRPSVMKRFGQMLLLALGAISCERSTAHAAVAGATYALQSVDSGKNIRPRGAQRHDGNSIILYDDHAWMCMTWELVPSGSNVFQLENRYTKKTFRPVGAAVSGAALEQTPLSDSTSHAWELLPQPDGTFLIELAGSELVLSATSDATNSSIVLAPRDGTPRQLWRLVQQDPWI